MMTVNIDLGIMSVRELNKFEAALTLLIYERIILNHPFVGLITS